MKILFGLGNPGKSYYKNRHNTGFMVADSLATSMNVRFRKRSRLRSAVAQASINNESLVLAKPLTYMNNSGLALELLRQFYEVSVSDILVIYDDSNLKLGLLRFAKRGSAGGHKGMFSIIQAMATQQIMRLRIGIGSPSEGDLSDYVLSDFDDEQLPIVVKTIERSRQACIDWASYGIDFAMQKYNGIPVA